MIDHAEEPFATVPCCDAHDELGTRALLEAHKGELRRIANAAGIAYEDAHGFLLGTRLLTAPARAKVREACR